MTGRLLASENMRLITPITVVSVEQLVLWFIRRMVLHMVRDTGLCKLRSYVMLAWASAHVVDMSLVNKNILVLPKDRPRVQSVNGIGVTMKVIVLLLLIWGVVVIN
jgi:hypothetical protein